MHYYEACAMELEIGHLRDQDPQPLLDAVSEYMHEMRPPAKHAVDPSTG